MDEKNFKVEVLSSGPPEISMRVLHLPTGLGVSGNSEASMETLKSDLDNLRGELIVELIKRVPNLPKLRPKADDWSL